MPLRTIINLMSTKLDWTENKVVTDEESNVQSHDDNQKNLTEETQKIDVCKFYKNWKCRFGKTGKKPDWQGKVCLFSHPQTYKRFEMYGEMYDQFFFEFSDWYFVEIFLQADKSHHLKGIQIQPNKCIIS